MKIKTPKLPDPTVIRNEIDAMKSRIAELRKLLPLAEVQRLAKSLINQREVEDAPRRKATT